MAREKQNRVKLFHFKPKKKGARELQNLSSVNHERSREGEQGYLSVSRGDRKGKGILSSA